jgi:hypothetical protein
MKKPQATKHCPHKFVAVRWQTDYSMGFATQRVTMEKCTFCGKVR